MSDPIDIKALDEYLKGGSDISQRYRELGRDDVPPQLDRRVLEAARAAVANDSVKRSRSWLRWSAPLALAASVVLVVTVVIESGVQNDPMLATQAPAAERKSDAAEQEFAPLAEEPASPLADAQFVQDAPVAVVPEKVQGPVPGAVPAAPPPPSLAKAEAKRASNLTSAAAEEVRADAAGQRDRESAASVAAAVANVDSREETLAAQLPTPPLVQPVEAIAARRQIDRAEPQQEADDTSELSETSVTGSRSRRATGRTAGPRNTISSSASGGALAGEMRAAADEAEHADPEKWLEEIRGLRRAGKAVAADREWQQFRAAFPDFRVADDDLARKKP